MPVLGQIGVVFGLKTGVFLGHFEVGFVDDGWFIEIFENFVFAGVLVQFGMRRLLAAEGSFDEGGRVLVVGLIECLHN